MIELGVNVMEEKVYKNLKYIGSYPKDFDKNKKYPLLIHIHGAGGRGEDLSLLKQAGPLFEIENGKELPFIVIAPQCFADTWFEIMEQLLEFIDTMVDNKNVDKSRVYLSGVSMGGYTCWQVAMIKPEIFAAIVPVCGGGMNWNAEKLKNTPIWAFHGAMDDVVCVSESIKMVNAVNKNGGNAKLTIYPDVKHNSWEKTFHNDELYAWLLEHNLDQNVKE